ncbi:MULTISPECIES: IDEAL domain-containing protein [Sporosarcina]|uniref:IDEAL domain-containing protein n=1 Tax=Sporosarcina TaxID=1569 RepID=UPI0030D0E126
MLQIDMALDAGDMELFMQLTNELKMGWRVMVFPYMVPVYGLLVKVYTPEFDSLPEQYQIPVAEYLVGHVEKEK